MNEPKAKEKRDDQKNQVKELPIDSQQSTRIINQTFRTFHLTKTLSLYVLIGEHEGGGCVADPQPQETEAEWGAVQRFSQPIPGAASPCHGSHPGDPELRSVILHAFQISCLTLPRAPPPPSHPASLQAQPALENDQVPDADLSKHRIGDKEQGIAGHTSLRIHFPG
jgi:hypothetical protein